MYSNYWPHNGFDENNNKDLRIHRPPEDCVGIEGNTTSASRDTRWEKLRMSRKTLRITISDKQNLTTNAYATTTSMCKKALWTSNNRLQLMNQLRCEKMSIIMSSHKIQMEKHNIRVKHRTRVRNKSPCPHNNFQTFCGPSVSPSRENGKDQDQWSGVGHENRILWSHSRASTPILHTYT